MAVTGDNSTFKAGLRRHIVDSLVGKFDFDSRDKFFLFIGKVDGWTAGGTFGSIADTRSEDLELNRNIVGMKQIDTNGVFRMIPRYDWTNNTIYTPYDDTVDMTGKTGYVMTSSYHIYKCMGNNNGAASAVAPSGTKTVGNTVTSDGYVWKYMYTVPEPYRYYIDDDYIPVTKLRTKGTSLETQNQWSTQTNAIRGGIETVLFTAGGNYTNNTVLASGAEGSDILIGAEAGATQMNVNFKHFKTNLNKADDDLNGLSITITTGDGAGQRRKITDYDGATAKISFDTPLLKAVPIGSRYEIAPSVNIYGDGVSAEAFARLYDYEESNSTRKEIKEIVITNPGKDYTFADFEFAPAAILPSVGSGGPGTARAIISPQYGHGADVANELNATTILMVANVDEDEDSKFFLGNEVRQYGIIKNPILNDYDSNLQDVNGYPYRVAGSATVLNTYLEVAAGSTSSFLSEGQYTVGNYIIGKDSKATAKIQGWGPATDRNRGLLTVSNVQGRFIAPVDSTGTGEFISEFSQSGDNWSFAPVTDVATVSAFDEIYQNTTPAFSCTTTLGISNAAGNLTVNSYPLDSGVTGASAAAGCTGCPTATVLAWTVNDGGTGGDLVLVDVRGTFATGDKVGSSTSASTTTVINTITPPDIYPGSGEIIYAQNMLPIEKDPEQREQYQVILKF